MKSPSKNRPISRCTCAATYVICALSTTVSKKSLLVVLRLYISVKLLLTYFTLVVILVLNLLRPTLMTNVRHARYRKPRKLIRSQAELVLRIRNYFEKEKLEQRGLDVNRVLNRTAAATGLSRALVAQIKTEEDVQNWKYDDGDSVTFSKTFSVRITDETEVGSTSNPEETETESSESG